MAAALEKVIMSCPVCGTEFIRVHNRQKYCSLTCQQEAYKDIKKENDLKRIRKAKAEKARKEWTRETLEEFDARARREHMTYGQLQALETLARLKEAEGSSARKEGKQ